MSFKLKYEAFRTPEITLGALRKVYTHDKYSGVKSAYKIKRMCDNIEKEMKNYMDLREEVHKTKDQNKIDELHDHEVEIKFGPLNKEEFEMFSWSPADLAVMEHFTEPSVFSDL